MQSTSLAPELSATRSRDSCWIISPAPALRPAASASAWTGAGSRSPGPGRPPWPCCPDRGRRGAWCAAPSSRSGDGVPVPPRTPPRWRPCRRRRQCPHGPCGGSPARRSSTRRPSALFLHIFHIFVGGFGRLGGLGAFVLGVLVLL